uniref:Dynein axonemal assembly factor 1 homolog n=1 Tax=Glossina austeni TaxID=7395 RepID=A0A1A9VDI5_GLOAU
MEDDETVEISEGPQLGIEGGPLGADEYEHAAAIPVIIISGVQEPNIEEILKADPDCYELDLNHNRIEKLEKSELLTRVERWYVSWNLIKKIENLYILTSLVELELSDNQISRLENFDSLVNLPILDVSFNRLTKIENLKNLLKLEKLYIG